MAVENRYFSWSNFDIGFLKDVLLSSINKLEDLSIGQLKAIDETYELCPFMNRIASKPDRHFVNKYRNEIDTEFLKNNPEILMSVFGTEKDTNPNTVYMRLIKKPLGELLAEKYLTALYRVGCNNEEYEYVNYQVPVTIDLTKSKAFNIELYDFQKDAVKALKDFSNNIDSQKGLLVMPTGSGKTRTAVYFLLTEMIAKGYQVIWLAHRNMLLEQAADQFKNMSPLIEEINPDAKKFNFVCVSGDHATVKSISKKEDLIISSIQTAGRSIDYFKKAVRKNAVVVCDEAHHFYCSTYRNLFKALSTKCNNLMLLGLTATPVRINDEQTRVLQQLFDNNIIYNIRMDELIKQGILADPVFEHIKTDINFETNITDAEVGFLNKYQEIPQTLINKIADSKQRNSLILKQFFSKEYGKTLMFALNVPHARLLCEELRKKGVNCDCVFSGRKDNNEVINKFHDGKIDVLVNVNILTEGSDIPDIDTVFLTRQTSSESLLMQMIGRGLRGPKSGGTEKATIVDFVDSWDIFNYWRNPEFILGAGPEEDINDVIYEGRTYIEIPWSKIRGLYKAMGSIDGHITESQTVPIGWYDLENEGEPYTLIVFADQISGYKKLIYDKQKFIDGTIEKSKIKVADYFKGFSTKPTAFDFDLFIDNLISNDTIPYVHLLKDRYCVDPSAIAKKIKEDGKEIFSFTKEIYDEHSDIIEQLFGTLEEYREKIFKIINYGERNNFSEIEEVPIEFLPFALDKPYDINELYKEVEGEMAPQLAGIPDKKHSASWTEKPVGGYFGVYHGNTDEIEINCILNSSSVPREAVKYVLYHEMLHRKYWYHDKTFRALEHKYPYYTELEKFLDSDFNNYTLD